MLRDRILRWKERDGSIPLQYVKKVRQESIKNNIEKIKAFLFGGGSRRRKAAEGLLLQGIDNEL